MLMLRRPGVSQPAFFFRSNRQDLSNMFIREVQIGQSFQGLDQLQTDMIDIAELLRHHQQRTQHDPDGLRDAVTFVNDGVGQCVGPESIGDPGQCSVTDVLHCPPDPVIERGSKKSDRFSGAKHDGELWPQRRPSSCAVPRRVPAHTSARHSQEGGLPVH